MKVLGLQSVRVTGVGRAGDLLSFHSVFKDFKNFSLDTYEGEPSSLSPIYEGVKAATS